MTAMNREGRNTLCWPASRRQPDSLGRLRWPDDLAIGNNNELTLHQTLLQKSFNVIPAKPAPEVGSPGAGIQVFQGHLHRGCHRDDGFVEFCKRLTIMANSAELCG